MIMMKATIKVGDLMTRDFISAKPETSLYHCCKAMVNNKVGSLIIQDGKKVHGILTEKDIIGVIVKRKDSDMRRIQARDIAARKLITIGPDDEISVALGKMRRFYHKRLPVVVNREVVGMITIKDILKVQPNLFIEISDAFKIREEIEKIGRVSKLRGVKFRGDGICEECGNLEALYKSDGILRCENCMI